MEKGLLPKLRCPECRSEQLTLTSFKEERGSEVIEGALRCTRCHRWYPIEEGILEFLPDALAYWDDRSRFFARHKKVLKTISLDRHKSSRNAQMEKSQQSYFDWYAANSLQSYSEYARSPFWRATDRLMFEPWKKQIPRDSWVLDVGCAQGRSTFQLSDLPITLVGFDVSKNMIAQASAASKKKKMVAKTIFFVGDASAFSLKDNSFDVVLLYGVLHHLHHPEGTISEIMRVLKSAGLYFGLENNKTPVRAFFDLLQRLKPLWYEEAGSMPLISREDFMRWLSGKHDGLSVTMHTFIPPHLVNTLNVETGAAILRFTDTIGQRSPSLGRLGGLIRVVAKKK